MKNPLYKSWLQCSEGCPPHYDLTEIICRCPACGNLLEVKHDLDRLSAKSGQEWRATFETRSNQSTGPDSSGVWSRKEWVCPEMDDRDIVTIGEGRTPLFDAKNLAKKTGIEKVWIKLCGNSHTGSFKDLGMTVLVSMVKRMIAQGQPIKAVACASTGDTSAALAAYCAAAGIPAIVLLPRAKITTAQLIQPIANGARTFSLDGDFDACMEIVRQLTETKEIYLANSMNSLRVEGQKTVIMEIVQQLNWQVPDWILVPGGNLGNIAAIGKGLLEMQAVGVISHLPRIVCAQTERANPLYQSYKSGFEEFSPQQAETTLASAIQIGNPVSIKKAIRVLKALDGVVEQVGEEELADASALADRSGLFACPQTGVALGALLKLAEKGEIKPKDHVVVISTAHGLKFAGFKVKYHERRLSGVSSRFANVPHEVDANLSAIRTLLDQSL